MNEIYDLIIILENLFMVGIFQYLCVHKKKLKQGIIVSILLTLESYFLFYLGIPEELKLIVPIATLLIYSFYLTNQIKLHNFIAVFTLFLNLIIVKSLIILTVCLISQKGYGELAQDYGNLAFMTMLCIIVLGLEYFLLEHKNGSDILLPRKSSMVLIIYTIISCLIIVFTFLEYAEHNIKWEFCFFIVIITTFMLFLTIYVCISNGIYYAKNLEQSLRLEAYDYEDKYIDAITERTVEYNKL